MKVTGSSKTITTKISGFFVVVALLGDFLSIPPLIYPKFIHFAQNNSSDSSSCPDHGLHLPDEGRVSVSRSGLPSSLRPREL